MHPRRFPHGLVIILVWIVCFFALRSWSSAQAEARSRQLSGVPVQGYFPLIMKYPSPTPTRTPTKTPTATPGSPGCPSHNAAYELELYDLINDKRAEYGLPALTPNYSLETSAGEHSDDMAIHRFISHTGSDGSTFWERAQDAGYDGAWGAEIIMHTTSPQAAMDWWMNDAPHRDAILGNYQDYGAGYAYCVGDYGGYFTVDFGHR